MKRRMRILVALIGMLLVVSAVQGQQLYSNFPVSGLISAFQVNQGYSVSNSFALTVTGTIGEAVIGAWVNHGDSVTGISWSLGTSAYDVSLGSGVAGATTVFNFTNPDGFDVDTVSFAIPNISLPAGTYYLTLSSGVSAAGGPVYWDINDASVGDAWDSSYGHVSAGNACFNLIGISGTCASSFQLLSTSAALGASAATLSFGNQALGVQSSAQVITVTNNGSSAATITGIAVTGANAGDFAQTNNCPISPATLAASGVCTISVTFTPTAANARAAAVTLTGSSPLSVGLSGAGVAPPAVTLSAASISFANQLVNTSSGAQTFTITNTGGALTIGSIAVTGANQADFAQTNNCPISPNTIATNGTCTVSVTFTPQGAGPFTAAVTITDNAANSPQSVNLSGAGVASGTGWPNGYTYQATFTVASGRVSGTLINFPALINQPIGDWATVANGGKIQNTCTQSGAVPMTIPADLIFTSDAAGATLLPGWEFESYAAASGSSIVWLNVPGMAAGTVVYAWYGNSSVTSCQGTPSGTWNSNYLRVWHLANGSTLNVSDSTSNAGNATNDNATATTGQIDGAASFNGTNAYLQLANEGLGSLVGNGSFTLSFWAQGSGTFANTKMFQDGAANGSNPSVRADWANPTTVRATVYTSGITNNLSATATGTNMNYFAVTYASGTGAVDLYVNAGTPATATNTGTMANGASLVAGRAGGLSSAYFPGTIDEIRINKTALPAAWLTAEYNNQSAPVSFWTVVTGGLNGAGAPPAVTLSAASISFANQVVNTSSGAQTFTITNTGGSALTIGSIAVTGANQADFAQTNNCPISPNTMAANGTCTVSVTFTPQGTSPFTAAVTITDNAANSPQSVSLSGTGVTPPAVTLSAPSISFANQVVNTTSGVQTFTITNTGGSALTISSIAVTGANQGDFAQTNNCPISPNTMAANGTCTVSVTFTPQGTSPFTAAVTITDNAANSPQSVSLSGTGVTPPAVTLSAPSISFANQVVNTSSGAQTFTITNTGGGALTISSIAVTGANQADFAQTNNCPISPNTMAANGTCTVSVTFTPQGTSPFTAAVTITDNTANSPQSVSLSGTGVAPGTGWPNGYTYQATFTVASGQVSGTLTNFPALINQPIGDWATVANGGKIQNTCTQSGAVPMTIPADLIFTSDAAGATLLPGWEFESYSAASGSSIVWLNVPSMAVGTVVYAWYGNSSVTTCQGTPSGTWNSNYLRVWHLANGSTLNVSDSTSNAGNATNDNATATTGQIDGAASFNGTNAYLQLANEGLGSLVGNGSFTLSFWAQGSGTFTNTKMFQDGAANGSNPSVRADWANPTTVRATVYTSGITNNLSATATGTNMNYFAVTYASGTGAVDLYVNAGTPATATNTGTMANGASLVAGRAGGSSGAYFPGTIDEIRINKTALPAAWITAEHNNQSAPTSFWTVVTTIIP